jgi:two-component system cell cycle sensor histidine kinase/response regulator CckA
MQFATGHPLTEPVAQSPGRDPEILHENEIRSLSEKHSPQSRDYFEIVARATLDAVRDLDLTTGQLFWPKNLEPLLGYAPAETQEGIAFWQNNLHPEDQAQTIGSIRAALENGSEQWSGEYRFRRVDGTYANLLERAFILRDANGIATRFIGSIMDITARKQLQDQLCRSQKMEAFGQLAGGLAHDFNNFLTTILGYSDLLLHERSIKKDAADHIAEIRKAAGRASTLTQQLLAFSRKQPLEPKVVEVNLIVTNLERSLLRLLGENISVACHLHREKDGAHIKADSNQIAQIVLNLAVNARDAMPKGGQLTIETATVDLRDNNEPPFSCGDFVPGEYVLISVSDNGAGMSENVKSHLFEPFFTTKDDGKGSGLGLATCYGIVHQSGGHIRVESQLGKGTTVRLYLPKVPAPLPAPYKKSADKKLPRGTETILVLEDDVSVRHISVRALCHLGYRVIEAANGDDAQRLITEHNGQKIDLLLTDMVMPQMSGRRFADWLRTNDPNLKVIFISGYLEESLHPGDRRDPEMFFLPKPFDQEQLALKVREALDS